MVPNPGILEAFHPAIPLAISRCLTSDPNPLGKAGLSLRAYAFPGVAI